MTTVELDLAVWPQFHRMSQRGLLVDTARVEALLEEVRNLKQDIMCKMAFAVGSEFNPASADQVADYIIEAGLGCWKRTKGKGRPATDERTLAGYSDPVLKDVVEFRGLNKLEGTFLVPLLEAACANDNVIHPKWKLTRVRSGRVAMEDPNLLAFPVRDDLGRRARDCFVARPGMRMVSIDYSQIEPRIAAALSCDPTLLEIYRTGRDLYTETARKLFRLNGDTVDPFRHRLPSKTTTLGVLYGIGPQKLYEELQRVGCGEGNPLVPYFDLDACAGLISAWFRVYPEVTKLIRTTIETAKQQGGWVFTVGGRGRFLPGLLLDGRWYPHSKLREESGRQAFNHLIQGTAQEKMKEGMLRVDRAGLPFEPLLQLHDELIGEVPADCADDVAKRMAEIMECEFRGVTLKTEAKVADSWGGLA
jgi:DNA polymerase-1